MFKLAERKEYIKLLYLYLSCANCTTFEKILDQNFDRIQRPRQNAQRGFFIFDVDDGNDKFERKTKIIQSK